MKKTILTFGLISGAISSLMMWAFIPFIDQIGFDKGMVIGYTTMVLSFLLVFFGIRSYRDNVAGGKISFGKAFAVGILITLVSCMCYVGSWQVLYFKVMPDFAEKISQHAVDQVIASGASREVIEAKVQEMKSFIEMYNNPLFNAALTFLEPFPVGLIMTVISAAILRKREVRREPGRGGQSPGDECLAEAAGRARLPDLETRGNPRLVTAEGLLSHLKARR